MNRFQTAATVLSLLLVLLSSSAVQGQMKGVGEIYDRVRVDLNRDGAVETVALRVLRVSKGESGGWESQLIVLDPAGHVVWQSPASVGENDPLYIGAWDYGVMGLEAAGDLDNDGSIEVVITEPQSDVRPPHFRVLRWSGSTFRKVRSQTLVERQAGSGVFVWTTTPQGRPRYIAQFFSVDGPGRANVKIQDYKGGTEAFVGRAVVQIVPGGMRVMRWIRQMHPFQKGD